jgi:nucleoside phosphorylase
MFEHNEYTIGWVCALPCEMMAAEVILDASHAPLPQNASDSNCYRLGRIGAHNVVIACATPSTAAAYDTADNATAGPAATAAKHLLKSFPSVTCALLVGIGGGVPRPICIATYTPAATDYDDGGNVDDGPVTPATTVTVGANDGNGIFVNNGGVSFLGSLFVGSRSSSVKDVSDVRLGDVVVGEPNGKIGCGGGGLVQYDYDASVQQGRFVRAFGMLLQRPPSLLLTALRRLKKQQLHTAITTTTSRFTAGTTTTTATNNATNGLAEILANIARRFPHMRATVEAPTTKLHDWLFEADYDHVRGEKGNGGSDTDSHGGLDVGASGSGATATGSDGRCGLCDTARLVRRQPRSATAAAAAHPSGVQHPCSPTLSLQPPPRVFYGRIASGKRAMRHGATRDLIGHDAGSDLLCFESAAAGLPNDFPCLVVRGVSDYADSHAGTAWRAYAALTAAAYARQLLLVLPPTLPSSPSARDGVAAGGADGASTNVSHSQARAAPGGHGAMPRNNWGNAMFVNSGGGQIYAGTTFTSTGGSLNLGDWTSSEHDVDDRAANVPGNDARDVNAPRNNSACIVM